MEEAKLLPQAVELEKVVLGAILLDSVDEKVMGVSMSMLTPDMFYSDVNREIFSAIQQMQRDGKKIDLLTVTQYLQIDGRIKTVGGAYYISQLTNRVGNTSNIEFHAYIVMQMWVLRQIIHFTKIIESRAYNRDEDIFGLFDLMRECLAIENLITKGRKEVVAIEHLINLETEEYDKRATASAQNKSYGVPTGFFELDKTTNGWQNGDLIILAARPAMGKTALVLSLSKHASVHRDYPVAFFSLEQPATQIIGRMLCDEAEIDNEVYKHGRLDNSQIQEVEKHRARLAGSKLIIDDEGGLSINEFRVRCRKMKEKNDIKMIVVDYLQLMTATTSTRRNNNREQEVSEISRGLKATAKELNVPVIALSQLSRELEKRGDKRPQLSDLRDSGSIEQDADMVLFIHRPEYYGQQQADGNSSEGLAEIIIAKHRNGATGSVNLRFTGKYYRFSNWDDSWYGGLKPNTQFEHDKF